MGDILINPGSGSVNTGTWEQAYENIKQFIIDCEIPIHIESTVFSPDGGRYLFSIKADNYDWGADVQMPGLPLHQVRYMAKEGQNPYDFPRLYIGGSSWLWKYALVGKEEVVESLSAKLEDLEYECECIKQQIAKLK